jgi:hypothetical protein
VRLLKEKWDRLTPEQKAALVRVGVVVIVAGVAYFTGAPPSSEAVEVVLSALV